VGLTRVAVARPVFMLMVISAMVILGLVSYTRLNQELFPSINIPIVTVLTAYPGAGADDVERLVTRPVEDAVSGIANVDVVSSSSREGLSTVTITFTDAANLDTAATDVERRVGTIRGALPADAAASSVLKVDTAALPVLSLALTGEAPASRLYDIAANQVKPRLETRGGVASVGVAGGLQREVQVQVDPDRLRAFGLTLDQVAAALPRENQGVPGGSLEQGRAQTSLRLYGLVQSVEELRDLVVVGGGRTVRLRDVADVVDGYKRVTSRTFLNGREAIGLTVTKQSSANELSTVDAVRAEIARLNRTLPSGAHIEVVTDTSTFTRRSLQGVQRSLAEAVLLTGLVLLLFLHTLRSTVVVLFAIPTSLITTFLVMNALGFSLNIMSSLALVLVIGVLVDDSIVVLENIARHVGLGEPPRSAALTGRAEIGLAAIAITLVDVVVFTPTAFLSGTVGSFFRQFGLVIASATLISLFISFTLTPLLASRWLRSGAPLRSPGRGPWSAFVRGFEAAFGAFLAGYGRALDWSLRHRWLPPLVAVAALVGSGALVPLGLVKAEFQPAQDNGLFTLQVELPPGSSLQATEDALRQVEQRLARVPEVRRYLSTSGVASAGFTATGQNARFGQVLVTLTDRQERTRDVFQIAEQVRGDLAGIPRAAIRASANGGQGGQAVQVRVTGDDPAVLRDLAGQVEATLRALPTARDVTNSATLGSPETRLVPDRARMADLGVSTQQAAIALRSAVEGTVVTQLRPQGQESVDVRLVADPATRASLDELGQLPLAGARDGAPLTVTLGQVTRAEQVSAPASIDRRNRQRLVTVGTSPVGNAALTDVTTPLQRALNELKARGAVPPGYDVALGGQAEQQATAFAGLLLALGLSVTLEYMLLAALYESMILPFATMFALPLAMVGALVGLAATRNTLNLLSMIGVIVLMGLVGKNGILLVDFANTLRERGLDREAALHEAGLTRLRPIVMTTLALVFGMAPLALQLEEGSELYAAMAVVIIGGMLSSTALSLLVVPCIYTYFDDLQGLIVRAWRWRPFRRSLPPSSAPPATAASRPELVGAGGRSDGRGRTGA
jgi:HAE1 family hydrophobic/amphiphilic exporter-1